MNLPTIPMSPKQAGASVLIALVTAAFVVIVYHYATRSPAEPGA